MFKELLHTMLELAANLMSLPVKSRNGRKYGLNLRRNERPTIT